MKMLAAPLYAGLILWASLSGPEKCLGAPEAETTVLDDLMNFEGPINSDLRLTQALEADLSSIKQTGPSSDPLQNFGNGVSVIKDISATKAKAVRIGNEGKPRPVQGPKSDELDRNKSPLVQSTLQPTPMVPPSPKVIPTPANQQHGPKLEEPTSDPTRRHHPQDYRRWFANTDRRPVELANDITILVGIPEIKKEMAKALLTITGPEHYVYMCNWKAEASVRMLDPGQITLMDLLNGAAAKGAKVRSLLFAPQSRVINGPILNSNRSLANLDKNFETNSEFAGRIRGLTKGEAVLDDKRLMWGSHHQKILIVRGNEGLIAFCGSYDPDHTREGFNEKYSNPWHEVSLRVKGPGAYRLLQTFLERWTDAVLTQRPGMQMNFKNEIGRSEKPRNDKNIGRIPAQVTVTIGDIKDNKPAHANQLPYDFAKSGERTFRMALVHAINAAQNDIYLECQFGWGESGAIGETITTTLSNAVTRGVKVTVVTPQQDTVAEYGLEDVFFAAHAINYGSKKGGILGGLLGGVIAGGVQTAGQLKDFKRAQDWFWWGLLKHGNNAPQIYHTHPRDHFIHSKLWIFDRQFALIGSANFNNRSLSHDSEVMVGFYDPSQLGPLRDALFRKHVSVPATKPYTVPRILYDNLKGVGNALSDLTFSKTIDPYGGPRELSQIDDTKASWVSMLDQEISAAIADDIQDPGLQ